MRTTLVAIALALAAPAAAQQAGGATMPESYRDVQLKALQLQRRMLLTIADSMPERLYADRAFETQGRDFAHQVHHAATAMAMIGTRIMGAPAAGVPDTSAATFTTRAGLKQYVNGIYDWAESSLKAQTPTSRAEMVSLFGSQMPRWQVWDELHTHTVWTAGSMVANFRKHGMAMPGFGFF
jgi:hypothetical protein